MALLKDPRGILTFIIRYLLLHVVFLIGLPLSVSGDLVLFYFFGFMGFFTFFQVLASISQKFLDHAGAWKALVIMGAVASDAVVLWWLGRILYGLLVGSDWELVARWLPFHFGAAFAAWGVPALQSLMHKASEQKWNAYRGDRLQPMNVPHGVRPRALLEQASTRRRQVLSGLVRVGFWHIRLLFLRR